MIARLSAPDRPGQFIVGVASAWVVTIGGLALLGYALNIRVLARPVGGGAQLPPSGAVAFIAAGAALCLVASAPAHGSGRHRASQLLGLLVALLAATVLAEYVTGRGAGIDLFLFPARTRAWAVNAIPGRLSLYSAIAFLLIGLSLAFLDVDAGHRHRPARILAAATAFGAGALLTGYLVGLTALRRGTLFAPGIALNTAVTFMILVVGILASRPGRLPGYLVAGSVRSRGVILVMGTIAFFAVLVTAITSTPSSTGVGLAATAAATAVVVLMYLLFRQIGTSLDIGGRALSDERDFSETVLRSMHEGVITIGPDGEVLQSNPRFCELTGLSAREIAGLKPPYPWWVPEDVPGHMATLPRALTTASVVSRDMRIRRADGTVVEVLTTAVPVITHGKTRMVVGTYSDITERNRVATAARRVTEQLDHFFDISTDLMCIAGIDGYFKRLNPAWERMLGYTTAELIAGPYTGLFHPDDMATVNAAAAALSGPDRVTLTIDSRIRCRDGRYLWLSWNATSRPESREIYAVARDTTEQRLADQAKALLAAIVDSTDDATVGTTLDGTIISWNGAAEHNYGYRSQEAIGQPFAIITAPDRPDEMAEILDRVTRGVPIRHHNTVRRRKDGTQLPVEVAVSPIRDTAGIVIGAASVARDITRRLNFQQELASARDEALAGAAAKSQFLAMASHEIRTPMNGVVGITALLLDTPLHPAQRRYAEAIRTSARGLLTIINDILDFSKIEAKKISLIEADFELGHLVESVTQVAAEAGRGKNLDIVGYYPPRLVTAVRGDEGRLRQVLLNLLGNAVKFTDGGGIVLRAVPATSDPRGGLVTLSVTDTGIGMTPEDLALMMTPFSQADDSASRKVGGTGLGLPIAGQLIELMGGQLDVQSQPAQGSQFSFTIPLAPQLSPPASTFMASDVLSGRRLLVGDGNPISRQLVSEHASAWGMTPTSVADGRAVLGQLREAAERGQAYDVAVIDQHLSDINGIDLAQRMASGLAVGTKLVLLTSGGYDDEGAATAAGAAVVPKPVCPSQLYNCLLNVLDPAAKAASHVPPSIPRSACQDQGLVLLAEDNEINQTVAADNLTMLGYRVDIACNGSEAVRMAATQAYKVIFMDCQMPTMDGYAATMQIREHERPDEHVLIIAMTAGAMAEDRERCLAAGMDDYIPKPIDPGQLAATLDRRTRQVPSPGS